MIDAKNLSAMFLASCLLAGCNSSDNDDSGMAAAPASTNTTPEVTQEPETEAETEELSNGKKSVFIGHSFFRPAAQNFENFTTIAGLTDHSQQLFFSGGASGTPARLWANADKRATIQGMLDEGGVELFGMTYHGDEPDVDGYVLWTEYALRENPDVEIFIALPWVTQPHNYTGQEHENLWEDFHTNNFHPLIDELRAEFPETKVFCVPYGAMAHDLQKIWDSGNLSDITALQGPGESSLYTDNLGHPGEILRVGGAHVWLNAIYNVDLADFDNGRGFQVDFNTIAMDISAAHDPAYSAQ